jgi:beta-lactamase superfamily II metal-dependent hydrolase
MLTLEALQANDGDCFLLHSDRGPKSALILVDGGAAGVYRDVIEKRLDQLRGTRPGLELRMVVVSHIDADHITGILDMFKQMTESCDDGDEPKWKVASLWHNSFEDVVGAHSASPQTARVVAAVAGRVDLTELQANGLTDEKALAVVASVKQGKDLRGFAKRLKTTINRETRGRLIVAPRSGLLEIRVTDDLVFKVIGPRQQQLDGLQRQWQESKAQHTTNESAVAADYLNRTVPNLSSIVFLVEQKGIGQQPTRILMTGDAGGDLILKGLEDANLLDEYGRIHLEILKVQHHGSNHSVSEEFFRRVLANAYVISGNGKHGIPHIDTLKWLSRARSEEPIDVYMTNRHLKDRGNDLTKGLDDFLALEESEEPGHRYHFREESELSIKVSINAS